MNNFMMSVKRFISNKNVITIIGVIVILGLLYFEYNNTIKKAVNPVRVPVAAKDLLPQTEITSADIEWINVPSVSKKDNVLTNSNAIVGKYVGVNSMIPEGSMFYASSIIDKEDLPGNWLTSLTTEEIPCYFNVNLTTTYSNAIQPGDQIDVYMKAEDENGLVMYGKLMENIEIKAVKDSQGEDVFKSSKEVGTPSFLYFGLESEFYTLIVKTNYLSTLGVEIIIVPHGGAVPVMGDVEVSSDYLRDYIDANTLAIPENEKKETTENTEDDNDKNVVQVKPVANN